MIGIPIQNCWFLEVKRDYAFKDPETQVANYFLERGYSVSKMHPRPTRMLFGKTAAEEIKMMGSRKGAADFWVNNTNDSNDAFFVEVKGPTDSLRPAQIKWLSDFPYVKKLVFCVI